MVLLTCPECDKRLKVQDSTAGKLVQCPGCKTRIRVPNGETDPADPPPQARTMTSAARVTRPESGVRSGKPSPLRQAPERVREDEDFDDDLEPEERDDERERRRKRRKKKRKKSEYSPMPAVLVCLGVASAVYALLVLWAAFARGGSLALLIGGGILFVCAKIWFIFIARQEDVVTYLLVRFVPFYSIYYFFTRLHDTYKPFILGSVGATFAITGLVAMFLRGDFSGHFRPDRFDNRAQAVGFVPPGPGRPANPGIAAPAGKQDVLFTKDDQLAAGDPRDKVLRGSHRKVYDVALKAGHTYVIDMVSNEFDAFLRLEDSDGKQLAQDDDGGDDLNARILFTPQRDGTYHIVATSLEQAVGKYVVTVREFAAAKK